MAITYQGIGTIGANSSAATTLNVPYPSGIQAGDVMVLVANVDSTTAPSLPSGWTAGVNYTAVSTQVPSGRVAVKVATGSESGNLAVTTPSATGNGYILLFRGVDNTTPIDVAGTTVSPASATTYNIPTLTTSRTGVALVAGGTANGPGGSWSTITAPATMTEVVDTTNAVVPVMAVDYLIWSGSGATGTVPIIRSSSLRGCGWMIALRPAATQQAVSGTVAGTSDTSATVALQAAVAGTAAASSGVSAAPAAVMGVSGATAAVAAASLAAMLLAPVSGTTVAAVSDVSGTATAQLAVAGQVDAVSDVAGAVVGGSTTDVSGTVDAVSGVVGEVGLMAGVAGAAAVTTTVTADVTSRQGITGSADAQTAVSGTVSGLLPITGATAGESATTGAVALQAAVSGTVVAQTGVTGEVSDPIPPDANPVTITLRETGHQTTATPTTRTTARPVTTTHATTARPSTRATARTSAHATTPEQR